MARDQPRETDLVQRVPHSVGGVRLGLSLCWVGTSVLRVRPSYLLQLRYGQCGFFSGGNGQTRVVLKNTGVYWRKALR